jgi:hypothetical protein
MSVFPADSTLNASTLSLSVSSLVGMTIVRKPPMVTEEYMMTPITYNAVSSLF